VAIDSQKPASRRSVLAAGLGALGGVAAARLGHPDDVAAVNPSVTLGANDATNQTSTLTQVENTTDGTGETSLAGHHAASGTGLSGDTSTGTGVRGTSATGTGLRASSTDNAATLDFNVASNKTGVIGTAGDLGTPGPNGVSINTDETGVYGYSSVSAASIGVKGKSLFGTGVVGIGGTGVYGTGGWGVQGDADVAGVGVYGNIGPNPAPVVPAAGVVARAELSTGIALRVLGRTSFSFSGRATVAAHKSSVGVTKAGVTSASLIVATLKTNRPGVYVQSVVSGTGRFTIYLNKAVTGTTYVAYLILG
jgi:hypothetical protein